MKNEYVLTFEDDEKYNEQRDRVEEILNKYNIPHKEFKYVKGFVISIYGHSIDEIAEKSDQLRQELSQLEGGLFEETHEFTTKQTSNSSKDSLYKTDYSDDRKYE